MEEQGAYLTDAVAAADNLPDIQFKALLVWYSLYWKSSAPFEGISFRDWLDYILETGNVG